MAMNALRSGRYDCRFPFIPKPVMADSDASLPLAGKIFRTGKNHNR